MKKIFLAACAILFFSVAFAQDVFLPPGQALIVATGSPTGTYHRIFTESAQVCAQPPLTEKPSKGTLENMDLLLGNQVNLAFVQSDVLFGKKLIENDPAVDDIRTLISLYPEEVHVIARSTNSNVNRFSDLGNKKIGTFGGSTISARVLFAKTRIVPIQRIEYADQNQAKTALDKGEIDALIAVGGQPLDWVKALNYGYKLVPFDKISDVSDYYSSAVLSYPNLSSTGVTSISVQSLLVTVNYKSASKRDALSSFKQCLADRIDDLRETTGNHPKWKLIDPTATSKWPMYETSKPGTALAPSKKKKGN